MLTTVPVMPPVSEAWASRSICATTSAGNVAAAGVVEAGVVGPVVGDEEEEHEVSPRASAVRQATVSAAPGRARITGVLSAGRGAAAHGGPRAVRPPTRTGVRMIGDRLMVGRAQRIHKGPGSGAPRVGAPVRG
ncbi:hypothetical protein Acsp07_21370 [Actinomycetospora sp. NBRC 106378]|nr:hypothetical protein Acsp07_21370 [Actinomycetospora sp. NBRC 106378]